MMQLIRLRRSIALALLLCLHLLDDRAVAAENPHLARGKDLYTRAEDERAVAALKKALAVKRSSRAERAEIHLYLGLAYFDLLKTGPAERHFREALRLDLQLQLPPGVSPKATQLFSSIARRMRPPAGSALGSPAPARPASVPAESAGPESQVVVNSSLTPRPGHWSSYWPAWTTLGIGVAATGTAIGLVLLARQRAEHADDLHLSYDEARPDRESAESLVLATNILWGVAGAAAIASGVLFYLGYVKSSSPVVSVVPLRAGALVEVGAIRW